MFVRGYVRGHTLAQSTTRSKDQRGLEYQGQGRREVSENGVILLSVKMGGHVLQFCNTTIRKTEPFVHVDRQP